MKALTPAEYQAAMAGRNRPLTDLPIGAMSAPKRSQQAAHSAAVTAAQSDIWPGSNPPDPVIRDLPRHGTMQRYFVEVKSGEGTCAQCRAARARYAASRSRTRTSR